MRGIRLGMQGIGVRMRGIVDENKGNHGEYLRMGVKIMNKKYGER